MITLLLAGLAFLALRKNAPAPAAPIASAGPAPAGSFKASFFAACAIVDLKGISAALLWPIAKDETANGTNSVNVTNNPFSIHGGPSAFWTGPTHTTDRGEILRVYPSLMDGIADGVKEISTSKHYRGAFSYAVANLPWQFYSALAAGDAGEGWVGKDPAKQDSYARALLRIYTTGS